MNIYSQFDNLVYLATGTAVQQHAYAVLQQHDIWKKLAPFTPVLAGSIPINIHIDSSDLDILCYYEDKGGFIETVTTHFSNLSGFRLYETNFQATPAVMVNFILNNFPVEIFAQPIPVKEQWGYRHMIIEHKLLQQKGETFRQQIIALKKEGIKTEPAFAQLLNLKGDPYEALLTLLSA